MSQIIHVLDTETTGLDPAADRVIEIAAVDVIGKMVDATTGLTQWNIGVPLSCFVNPGRPISVEAMGVHHIMDDDVADARDLDAAIPFVFGDKWDTETDILAAHNCRFDRDMLPPLRDKRWIDTYRCAMHLWPDAPNFKNGTLYYWLGLPPLTNISPHRASFDATMTANILVRMLDDRSIDDLLRLSTKAALLKKVGFGMHFGALWAEVPSSYLDWAARQGFDHDVKFTVKSEINRRCGVPA